MPLSKIQGIEGQVTPNLGRRNLIINGAMGVWQRGTSHTYNNSESGYDTVDRWYSAAFVSGGTLALSRQSADNVNVDAEYFLRATTTGSVSAGSATVYSEQKIENIKQFNGQQVTLSFYVKASASLTFQLRRHYYYGSGGSSEEYSGFTDVPVTTSWTRHTVTFAAQDFSSKTFGSANYFGIIFYWTTGQGSNQLNDASIDITNVQLELGDKATDFEHRSYGEELLLCQRYFSHSGDTRNNGIVHSCYTTTSAYANPHFVVTMRTAPTLTMKASGRNFFSNNASRTITAFTPQNVGTQNFQHHLQGSGFTAGDAGHADVDGNTRFFEADAEL